MDGRNSSSAASSQQQQKTTISVVPKPVAINKSSTVGVGYTLGTTFHPPPPAPQPQQQMKLLTTAGGLPIVADPLAFLPTQSNIVPPTPTQKTLQHQNVRPAVQQTKPATTSIPKVPGPPQPSQSQPQLDHLYLIHCNKSNGVVQIVMPKESEKPLRSDTSLVISKILAQHKVINTKVITLSRIPQAAYNRDLQGASLIFKRQDPKDPNRKTTFVIKYNPNLVHKPSASGAANPLSSQLLKKLPIASSAAVGLTKTTSAIKNVEVIDLDSDDDDDDDVVEALPSKQIYQTKIPAQRGRPRKNVDSPSTTTINRLSQPQRIIPPQSQRLINQQQQQKKTQEKPERPKKPDFENEVNISVIKGNVRYKPWRIPSKTIIPSSKSLSCLYRIPNLIKLKDANSEVGAELSYSEHPFLENRFVVVSSNAEDLVPVEKKKNNSVAATGRKRKNSGVSSADSKTHAAKKVSNNNKASNNKSDISSETRSLRTRNRQPLVTKAVESVYLTSRRNTSVPQKNSQKSSSATTTRTRTTRNIIKEISLSPSTSDADSSSDSSSSSSDGSSNSGSESEDDENEAPAAAAVAHSESDSDYENLSLAARRIRRRSTARHSNNKNVVMKSKVKKQEVFKPPPRCFAEAKPCRPLRRSTDGSGRIYFSLNAKLSPNEYYKNADLFENWEKFVRNESDVGIYYKTTIMKARLTTLIIYHMDRKNNDDDGKMELDRIVELVSDGSIKITLQNLDVTDIYMRYVNIETNTHLGSLLLNLINSNVCPGCPGFSLVNFYPEAIYKDDVWYSGKCSKVVFNDPSIFIDSITPGYNDYSYSRPCAACAELKTRLEKEKQEIIKMNLMKPSSEVKNQSGRKGLRKPQLVFGKYHKPSPPVESMQVRKAMSDLFLDFWKEMGFQEEQFPSQTHSIEVDVVKESDLVKVLEEKKRIEEAEELILAAKLASNQNDQDLIESGALLAGLEFSTAEDDASIIPIIENIEMDENISGRTFLTYSSDLQFNLHAQEIQIMEGQAGLMMPFSTDPNPNEAILLPPPMSTTTGNVNSHVMITENIITNPSPGSLIHSHPIMHYQHASSYNHPDHHHHNPTTTASQPYVYENYHHPPHDPNNQQYHQNYQQSYHLQLQQQMPIMSTSESSSSLGAHPMMNALYQNTDGIGIGNEIFQVLESVQEEGDELQLSDSIRLMFPDSFSLTDDL